MRERVCVYFVVVEYVVNFRVVKFMSWFCFCCDVEVVWVSVVFCFFYGCYDDFVQCLGRFLWN